MAHSSQTPVFLHLIGVTGYARQLLRSLDAIMESAGASLVSATIVNPEEEAQTCQRLEAQGCRIHSDYQSMLAHPRSGHNLCLIPTSIHQHAPMSLNALRAGYDVLVEKPLAGNLGDAERILKEAQRLGRRVSVGFQDMYAPQTWAAKKALLAGKIGRIRSIQVTGSWPRTISYYQRNRWAGRAYCDGRPVFDSPINNGFAHFLNLALFFSGETLETMASACAVSGRLLRFFPIETFDTTAATFLTEGGIEIGCYLTHAAQEHIEPSIQIEAETGSLQWQHEVQATFRNRGGDIITSCPLDQEETNRRRMLQQVIACTRVQSNSPCPAASAIPHLQAVHLACGQLEIECGRESFGLNDATNSWAQVSGLLTFIQDRCMKISCQRV